MTRYGGSLSRLAQQYQISDVRLAKICRKLHVPRPPRGYWTKHEFGKRVRRLPLPKINHKKPIECTHYVYAKPKIIAKIDPAVVENISSDKEVKVPERLDSPHALVRKTKAILKNMRPDKYGMVSHYHEDCFSVSRKKKNALSSPLGQYKKISPVNQRK